MGGGDKQWDLGGTEFALAGNECVGLAFPPAESSLLECDVRRCVCVSPHTVSHLFTLDLGSSKVHPPREEVLT